MRALRLLAIAAGSRHVAYAFFTGDRLTDWKISDRARNGSEDVVRLVRAWIADLGPTAVVSERPDTASKKGVKAKALIAAIADEVQSANIVHVAVSRSHEFANKYEEAAFFAARYPDLTPWLPPKRIFYENEPRNMILFEAVALADVVLRDMATELARALG